MKKQTSRIWAALCSLVLVLCLTPGAQAVQELPELSRTGEISVHLRDGGQLSLYRVGDLVLRDNLFVYELSERFRDSGLTLQNPADPRLPEQLLNYARYRKLTGSPVSADGDGVVRLTDLPLGVYLLEQTGVGTEGLRAAPFLVTVPGREENGTLTYQVDASPKLELLPEPVPPAPPGKPEIPYTGQLNWPVPVLAVSGTALFLLGWFLYFGRRDTREK